MDKKIVYTFITFLSLLQVGIIPTFADSSAGQGANKVNFNANGTTDGVNGGGVNASQASVGTVTPESAAAAANQRNINSSLAYKDGGASSDGKGVTNDGTICNGDCAATAAANAQKSAENQKQFDAMGQEIQNSQGNTSSTSGGPTEILTSEEVPGANCICISSDYKADGATGNLPAGYMDSIKNNSSVTSNKDGTYTLNNNGTKVTIRPSCGDPTTRKYKCTIQPGLAGFQNIFATIIRYVVYITMLLGVLAVVGLGIAWAWAGGEDVKMKSNLKHWAINVLVGLTILFLFRYILTFLAPWIFQ